MNEDTLHKTAAKGRRAQSLIDSEALQAAFTDLKGELIETWEASKDQNERERIWHCVGLLAQVEHTLIKTANRGKVAKLDLDKLSGAK